MKTTLTSGLITALCLLLASSTRAQFQWAKKIGDGIYDKGKRLVTDNSGNVYTAGEFAGNADFDPGTGTYTMSPSGCFIQKMDAGGNFIWAKSFGGYSVDGISRDAGGNILLCGFFYGTVDFDPGPAVFTLTAINGNSLPNVYALKLDGSGNFSWAVRYGTSSTSAKDISNDANGNVFLTGQYLGVTDFDPGAPVSNMGTSNVTSGYILKLDAAGVFAWSKEMKTQTLGTSATGTAIQPDGLGNIITTGFFNGTVDFDPGATTYTLAAGGSLYDIFVQKLDAAGNFVWAVAVGSPTVIDMSYDIAIDASDNIYTCGSFGNSVDFDPGTGATTLNAAGITDAYVWKLDAGGNFVWAKNMGDNAWAIALDATGDVYTLGYTSSISDVDPGAGTYTVAAVSGFIQKLDAAGNFAWARGYFLGNSLNDISVSGADVYFTGNFNGTIDFDPDAPVFNLSSGLNAIVISKLTSYVSSTPSSLHTNSAGMTFKIFPNPSSGRLSIQFQKPYTGTMEVYDFQGKLIVTETLDADHKIEMDLGAYKSGIYFVKVNGLSSKIIIEN